MIKGAAFFFLRNDTIIYCDTSRILVILRPPFTYCVEGRFTRDFACCIRPPPLTWLGWLYECLSLKKRDADPFRAGKLHAILRLAATVAQQSQQNRIAFGGTSKTGVGNLGPSSSCGTTFPTRHCKAGSYNHSQRHAGTCSSATAGRAPQVAYPCSKG